MHPSSHLRSELAELRAEIAELRAKLTTVAPEPAPADPTLPPQTFIDHCGVLRRLSGEVYFAPGAEERARAAYKQSLLDRNEANAAKLRAMSDGCPAGAYKDQFGIMRTIADGRVVAAVEHETLNLSAVQRQQADEYRAWKRNQGLPVRGEADED